MPTRLLGMYRSPGADMPASSPTTTSTSTTTIQIPPKPDESTSASDGSASNVPPDSIESVP